MSALNGAKRMQWVGRRIVVIAIGIAVLLWTAVLLFGMISSFSPSGIGSGLFFLGCLFLFLAVQGATLWLAGWIVEGFAKS